MPGVRSIVGGPALLLAMLGTGLALAGAPKFTPAPPESLTPLDRVIVMTTGKPETLPALKVLDLSTGFALGDCPKGLWRGKVVFVGGLGGDIEYDGQLWRCFPFGEGQARYPNETSYTGTVNSYLGAAIKAASKTL